MATASEVRRLGDELRAVADIALAHPCDDAHHTHHFARVRRLAAELFAAVDVRDADEIERALFTQLTHIAPLPTVDAATFDDDGRLLLIRRADDGRWAMPGGALDLGETPSQGAVRETREEAGWEVEPLSLAGVWDSRFCGGRNLQLYMFVFLCRPRGETPGGATTPHEVLDVGWFDPADLPPLSGTHTERIPSIVEWYRAGEGLTRWE